MQVISPQASSSQKTSTTPQAQRARMQRQQSAQLAITKQSSQSLQMNKQMSVDSERVKPRLTNRQSSQFTQSRLEYIENQMARSANERRMNLQQQLLDEAMGLLHRKREIPIVLNDEENNLTQHQTWEGNGTALNICEVKVQDILPEQFIEYFKHQMEILPTYNSKVKIKPIDMDGDFQIVHQRFEMPFMICNRSFFNTYYHIDGCEPGEYQFIVSGIGNESFAQKHARIVGKDVVGRIDINFIGVRPIRNKDHEVIGTFVQQVQRVDLGGSIPDWYKKKKSARQAKDGILKLISYLEESMTSGSELEAAMSTGEEMAFYKQLACQDLRLQPDLPKEEQVLKIRLQSRRKLDSPLNRTAQQSARCNQDHRSCTRIHNQVDAHLVDVEDNENNCIVVRTVHQETVRDSIAGNSPINIRGGMGEQAEATVPVHVAHFGNDEEIKEEIEVKEEKEKVISVAGRKVIISPSGVQSTPNLNSLEAVNKKKGKGRKLDPQQARAKTYTLPKDFREELRKLQAIKQKQTSKNRDALLESGNEGRSRRKSDVRDVVTVTTLGLDHNNPNQQMGQAAQLPSTKETTAREESKVLAVPSRHQQPLLDSRNSESDEIVAQMHHKEKHRKQRQAEMDYLLSKLGGKLSKSQRFSGKRAHSSDLATVMKAQLEDE